MSSKWATKAASINMISGPSSQRLWCSGTCASRLRHDGSTVLPLYEDAMPAIAAHMRAEGVEAVATAFLHAYANGSLEVRARDCLALHLDIAAVSVGREVSPQMRGYERSRPPAPTPIFSRSSATT